MATHWYWPASRDRRPDLEAISQILSDTIAKGLEIKGNIRPQFDTIVEPYEGSYSYSEDIAEKAEEHGEIVINAQDPDLYDFLRTVQGTGSKALFEEAADHKDVPSYMAILEKEGRGERLRPWELLYWRKSNRTYGPHPWQDDYVWPNFDHTARMKKTDAFIRDAKILNDRPMSVIGRYKNDPNAVIFIDPQVGHTDAKAIADLLLEGPRATLVVVGSDLSEVHRLLGEKIPAKNQIRPPPAMDQAARRIITGGGSSTWNRR